MGSLLGLLWAQAAAARQPAEAATSIQEEPALPADAPGRPPASFAEQIHADRMSVQSERQLVTADGHVELRVGTIHVACERLTYFLDTRNLYAEGRVHWTDGANHFRGDAIHYNLLTQKGRFLSGELSSPVWHASAQAFTHLTRSIVTLQNGSVSSCELSPPHYALTSRWAHVFLQDERLWADHVMLEVEDHPVLYFPQLRVSSKRPPFFVLPGKKKPWEEFVLAGYRLDLPGDQDVTLHLDWRRAFGWGTGLTHRLDDASLGRHLFRFYYNEESNRRRPPSDLPNGADANRYRLLWRHQWQPFPETQIVTNLQEYSDADFRRELLFREEFTKDDSEESFLSATTSTPDYTLSALVRERLNRFNTVDEALPQITLEATERPIGETALFSDTRLDFANLQRKRAHSDNDTDVIRLDWFQQLKYALTVLAPLEVTPRAGLRQTYYSKDRQGGRERPQGKTHLLSGQFSAGVEASQKLFKSFPVVTNLLALNLNSIRSIFTPTIDYTYDHDATVPNGLLSFPSAEKPENRLSFGLDQKLQTKRATGPKGALRGVDLLRVAANVPYTFQGRGNEQGGRFSDWTLDLECTPWPWLRIETDTVIPSHFVAGTRDARITSWNVDTVIAGGRGAKAQTVDRPQPFEPGPKPYAPLLPLEQWSLGLGHRYSQNDKSETVMQWDWRLSEKWQAGVFHRFTWKEVVEEAKRFDNFREVQFRLQRDLHDWVAEIAYHADREAGEELFFTMTLKAFPELPLELGTSYHQPKLSSQSP